MAYNVLNKGDFDLELDDAGNKLVVVDFFANWCGPCKVIQPHLEELSLLYGDKVKVLKVNVDDCEDIAMAYNITSMPTFIFIKNQEILDVLVGSNVEMLAKNMKKYVEVGEFKEKKYVEADDEYEIDIGDDPSAMLEVIVDEQGD